AEGALDEVTNMLQRIRTLSLQSANGTNTTADRGAIQEEVKALCSEIGRIACKTTFAGQEILSGPNKGLVGNDGKISFQVGANAKDTISISLSRAFTLKGMADDPNVSDAALAATSNGYFKVETYDEAQKTLETIDGFIAYVDKARGQLGAVQNRLESTIANQSNIAENESDARSRIRDTDYAEEAANLSQQTIVQQAASSMLTQANSRPQIALSLLG
ncbi:MAG: flagellin, partial [Succinatimonas hippei]|nr:flagellin [Succinatimonas hippei]